MGEDYFLKFIDPDYLQQMLTRFPELASALPGVAGAAAFIHAMEDAKAKAELSFRQREGSEKWSNWVRDREDPETLVDRFERFETLYPWPPAGCDYVWEMASTYLRSTFGDCKPDMFEGMAKLVIDAYSEKVYEEKLKPYEKAIWVSYEHSKAEFQEYTRKRLDPLVRAECLDRWQKRIAALSPDREVAEGRVGSAGDTKASDEPARGKPATVDGEGASGSSKSEQAGGAVSATDEARPAQPQPATVANTGNTADRRGAEKIDAAPLSLADRTEIEQQLHQWREGIWIDISLLLGWSGELAVTIPPKSMEYFRELQPNLRNESFLRLSFDWEGSGREILNHDQITATLLKNLQKALNRYVRGAIGLISAKWAKTGIHPTAFASRMESAGEALEQDVFQMLRDGVSALANGASTDSLEQALLQQMRGGIAREIEVYRRNALLVGLCELPERDDAVPECQTDQEDAKPGPGKDRKGDASLLVGKRAVSFRTAEQYLGITERQRQYLVRDHKLTIEGKGQNRKITTESLMACLPPENPK